jgi:hypothetical protein
VQVVEVPTATPIGFVTAAPVVAWILLGEISWQAERLAGRVVVEGPLVTRVVAVVAFEDELEQEARVRGRSIPATRRVSARCDRVVDTPARYT